jgi:hypothetical protein
MEQRKAFEPHRLERADAVQDTHKSAMPIHLALRQEFVGTHRRNEPRIAAMLLEQQVGADPDLAILDHDLPVVG